MTAPIRLVVAFAVLLPAVARGSEPGRSAVVERPGVLRQLNGALSQLADRVSPAVVQILVSGYGPASAEDGRPAAAFVVRQRAVGSGVIVDSAGYIVTNAHVVQGGQRIMVVPPAVGAGWPQGQDPTRKRSYPARLLGIHPESDIAVLKIDATGLPALPLRNTAVVRQGELVFAVGTPQGLASTMTMGIVSSAARQIDVDAPMLFIQTDAPINPGNSGGPLVNAEGEVVGINTFIVSGSGGSEGLGFAVPAPVARFVYDGLRKRGYVHRVELGIAAQGITPQLASGLALPRDWGNPRGTAIAGGGRLHPPSSRCAQRVRRTRSFPVSGKGKRAPGARDERTGAGLPRTAPTVLVADARRRSRATPVGSSRPRSAEAQNSAPKDVQQQVARPGGIPR